jgi:GNAT superfamily N-acetyltransferase|tara:strand:- start:3667 stop:4122 length:456 start_codon:yes stop_codon:yes gene_type:complete
MSKVEIARARSAEGAGVATVYLIATAKLGFLPRRHTAADMWHHFSTMPTQQETWVAILNGRIAAFLAMSPDWIDHLYVHPRAQSTGLGTALLTQAKRSAPRGFQLWTFRQNKGAQRFYERHGLMIAERTDGGRNEEHLADLRYVWRPTKTL